MPHTLDGTHMRARGMVSRFIRVCFVAAPLAALACSDDPSGPDPITETVAEIRAPTHSLLIGDQTQLVATDSSDVAFDASRIAWSSSDPEVAAVYTDGTVDALAAGSVTIEAAVTGSSADLMLEVWGENGPPFASVVAGGEHTCALTPQGTAYCWGRNGYGQLGAESPNTCSSDYEPYTVACSRRPIAGAGDLVFATLAAGIYHTCGLTPSGVAYCWGRNDYAQLGDGTFTSRSAPIPVAGGYTFKQLSADYTHTCGITDSDDLLCWGSNWYGELGTSIRVATEPLHVAEGYKFRLVATEIDHTCGVTIGGEVLCWGRDESHQLGTATVDSYCAFGTDLVPCTHEPQLVTTDRVFTEIEANTAATCGLDEHGGAYCWGSNSWGRLGIGGDQDPGAVLPVVGNHAFMQLTVGFEFTCALEPDGTPWCWGRDAGTFGDGRDVFSSGSPVRATPRYYFASLSAGFEHTCGIATTGVTYCWGRNWQGQLGNGQGQLGIRELVPARVWDPRQ